MNKAIKIFTDGFVVWVLLFSLGAYLIPDLFTPLRPYIKPGLGIIMFGMGMTLLPEDFLRVTTMKRAVGCGILGQFMLMPLLALILAKGFRLDNELTMGFIILGCCPGGTASNVIAYLAKADVALSVTMTAFSTVMGVVLTPILIRTLGGSYLPVDAFAMFKDILIMVLIPVALGIGIRSTLKGKVGTVVDVFPAISVLVIVLIIATIVALSKDKIPEVIGVLGVLVVAHNTLGMATGYGLATLFKLPESARRTVAIEVGMQNSGLGVALASEHFTSAMVALPSSLFSIVHNLTGSVMANIWGHESKSEN
jgi:BASS family bile acid:Na+ symporter